jgi:hypothetical protein
MLPLVILNNFKFKSIFPLATNAKTTDVKMFDLKPFIVTSTLEPLVATFVSKLALELVNQICYTLTKKKTRDHEGIR